MGQIRIDSILGGHTATMHFAAPDQFQSSLGIDPSMPAAGLNSLGSYTKPASGLLRPAPIAQVAAGVGSSIVWMRGARGTSNVFAYGINGSTYVTDGVSLTSLADDGIFQSGDFHGLEYYDNYMYFATATNIHRYGPMVKTTQGNGTDARFESSVWTGTFGKSALTNTVQAYPSVQFFSDTAQFALKVPMHFLHRHSDGRLYIADVVGNQGVLHYISTKKNTWEGDTDNGSTASALTFGYGLHPTAIESYGSQLVVALYEDAGGNGSTSYGKTDRSIRAKIAFWDTTSANFNSITWVEFPDPVITAIKNVNGTLYVISTISGQGFRVSQYIGGYTFKEVGYFENGMAPLPGAVDGTSQNLMFGSSTLWPETASCIYSLGLQKSSMSNGLFSIRKGPSTDSAAVTALLIGGLQGQGLQKDGPIFAWGDGVNYSGVATDAAESGSVSTYASTWWSQLYNIGQPFQITRIRIPLANAVAANMSVTAKLYFDNGNKSQTLTAINDTIYPNAEMVANINIAGDGTNILMGQNNFWLELKWAGTKLCVVDLPIIIDFEVIPD